MGFQWRSFPHFAWTLASERTALVSGDSYYLGAGARVFAYERGAIDPFLELNLGGEARWQSGSADLDPALNFPGEKLDLGGWTANFTLGVRF